MSTALARAAARLNEFQSLAPDAVRLARLASLAVRIESHLLRRLRLDLLPDADAGVEADLWFSPLIESRGTSSIVLHQHVASLLREHLANDRELFEQAYRCTAGAHTQLSAVLQLEEQVTAVALLNRDDGVDEIEEAFRPVLRTFKENDTRAMEIARWMLRAAPRLPAVVWRAPTAYALVHASSVMLGGRRVLPVLPSGADIDIDAIAWTVPALASAQRVDVGVELRGATLAFGDPAQAAVTIEIPSLVPVAEVRWTRDAVPVRTLVEAVPGTTVDLGVAVPLVSIRTVAGTTYTLQRQAAAEQPDKAPPPNIWRPRQARVLEPTWMHEACVQVGVSRTGPWITGVCLSPGVIVTARRPFGGAPLVAFVRHEGVVHQTVPVRDAKPDAGRAPNEKVLVLQRPEAMQSVTVLPLQAQITERQSYPNANVMIVPGPVRVIVAFESGTLGVEAHGGAGHDPLGELRVPERQLPGEFLGAPVILREGVAGVVTDVTTSVFPDATLHVTQSSELQPLLERQGAKAGGTTASLDFERVCYVSMPSGTKQVIGSRGEEQTIDFDQAYERVVRPAIAQARSANGAALQAIRIDHDFPSGVEDRFDAIEHAAIMVADITRLSSTVLYELGARHRARAAGTIVVHHSSAPVPFNLSQLRVFPYQFETDEIVRESVRVFSEVLSQALRTNRPDNQVHLALRESVRTDVDYSRTCFVDMPFGSKPASDRNGRSVPVDFNAIYHEIFEPAIQAVMLPEGFTLEPKRLDEIYSLGDIQRDNLQFLEYSRLVLVDITGLNANVMYDLGVRHRARKSGTVIFRQPGAPIPFDINQIRAFDYDVSPPENILKSRDLITRVLTEMLAKKLPESPNPFAPADPPTSRPSA
jgi:hypothetical protein